MNPKSRKDNMNDLDSCNDELEKMVEKAESEKEEKSHANEENTVQAKVIQEIIRRGGSITWGNSKT